MALYHIQDTFRALPGGAGVSGVTVTFKRVLDNSTIDSTTTDSNGFFQKSLAEAATTGQTSYVLHPGPFSWTATASGYTRKHSSVSIGKAGPLDLSGLVQLSRAMGNGLISSPAQGLNTGAVTGPGNARTVSVATFAVVLDGITAWNDAARTLTIAANVSGSTRIDTIVVEMVKAGQSEEGKCTLKVVQGTPGAGAPTLTDSSSLVQFPLADVSVANGASVINPGDVTDRRDYVERSVTAVEADVADLDTRVDALEDMLSPVAYFQIIKVVATSINFPSAGSGRIVEAQALGSFTGVAANDRVTIIDSEDFLPSNIVVTGYAKTDQVWGKLVNGSGSSYDAPSQTYLIIVERVVLI